VQELADTALRDRRPHGRGRRAHKDVFTACPANLYRLTLALIDKGVKSRTIAATLHAHRTSHSPSLTKTQEPRVPSLISSVGNSDYRVKVLSVPALPAKPPQRRQRPHRDR
jgi:hypothetical protein